MKTIIVKPKEIQKKWYLIDAEGKELGHVAVAAANILRGKNKPEYLPNEDMGDYVIIINAAKAAMSGNKANDKMYRKVSGYAGGMKEENYARMIVRKPTFPMEHAVRGMLPHGALGRKLFTNMKVYADAKHPHAAQQPIQVEI
ncbi:MAG: 50S ribosomal protein L13 [Sphaerochaeta sp.]|mgnify:CR=1 FL=1